MSINETFKQFEGLQEASLVLLATTYTLDFWKFDPLQAVLVYFSLIFRPL